MLDFLSIANWRIYRLCGDNVLAFTASIDVAHDGMSVTQYYFRHDPADPSVLLTDYWRVVSTNDGQSWRESHVAGPFNKRAAPFA
jgi:hypothetical protein